MAWEPHVNPNQDKYDERLGRLHDAVALKEPDRVPFLDPMENMFAYFDRGYTMAEVLYDIEKAKDGIRSFLTEFEPDVGHGISAVLEGQGPMLEKGQCKMWKWAGMPGNEIPKNSVHQFIEYPLLEDGEFAELLKSRGSFGLKKMLPRAWGLLEPMRYFDFDAPFVMKPELNAFAFAFANPEVQQMVSELGELAGMWGAYWGDVAAFKGEVENRGYPVPYDLFAMVPFDYYSDYLRGTMNTSLDLYDHPEEVYEFVLQQTEIGVKAIRDNQWARPGNIGMVWMHKGMDGFLSDEHYEKFYWEPFMQIVDAIIERGMIPYLFTEGNYNTRFEFLKRLPKGKTLVHFEHVDMARAKKELGDVACITGNFPAFLLENGTEQQVIDEAKRQLDICAPGGGYMFAFDGGLYFGKRKNIEALYRTVKEYGIY
ncbi:MAG: hypothetical protein LBS58_02625 [Coriobacteriales bacterium]|jgi:hypothetical protein|nr:hypothetical protein [Coriobacteriales bacterium]